jgi:Bacterial regulatory proteins, luxR family
MVLTLVARGLTTKEMAHELGITERGVSAHISRMLARSGAHTRAGLIAHALSEDLGRTISFDSPTDTVRDSRSLPDIQQELIAYEDAPFFVGVTMGPDQILVYQNRMSRDLTARPQLGKPHRDVFQGDASQDWWREKGDEAFSTGRPVGISGAPSRWQRGDGTWVDEVFNCVAQPLRDALGVIRGVLWICATGHR